MRLLVSLAFVGKVKNLLKVSLFLFEMPLIKVSTPLSYMRAQINHIKELWAVINS